MKLFYITLLFIILSCESTTAKEDIKERSFVMGFTPWAYDFTEKAQQDVYKKILTNSDFISHHFDEGIPWNEALNKLEYPKSIRENIQYRLANTPKSKPIYLSVTPLSSQNRSNLALYYGDETNMPLPENWQNKPFNHPDVIEAYKNFCIYMVNAFQPSYFNYGIEVSGAWKSDTDPKFIQLLDLLNSVYKELKQLYPALPIFVSIQAHPESSENTSKEEHQKINMKCLKYSDYNAISLYPYANGYQDPNTLPKDYFTRLKDLAPEKPFVIAETGFTAKTLSFYDGQIIINGTEEWQLEYLSFALNEANKLDCKLFLWFLIQDYELAWAKLEQSGFDDIFKLWKNIGFINEDGVERESMKLWQSYLSMDLNL